MFSPTAINPIGHDLILRQLSTAITQNRISTAYLFQGSQGIGKSLVAMWFAQQLLSPDEGNLIPDDVLLRMAHPDLLWVNPKVKIKDQLLTPQEAIAKGEVNKTAQIYIEQIHSIRTFLSVPPLNHRKVVVIDGVEQMNTNAQNALLKTLEEPATGHFILIQHENQGAVLNTIASRAQCFRFNPLSEADFAAVLQELDPSLLEMTNLVQYANGSPGILIDAIYHCNQIPAEVRQLLQIKPNQGQKVQLTGKLHTLPNPVQIWLLKYLQRTLWSKYQNTAIVSAVEQSLSRFNLNCQPQLTWQLLLVQIPIEGIQLPPVLDWAEPPVEPEVVFMPNNNRKSRGEKPKARKSNASKKTALSSSQSKVEEKAEEEESGTRQTKLF